MRKRNSLSLKSTDYLCSSKKHITSNIHTQMQNKHITYSTYIQNKYTTYHILTYSTYNKCSLAIIQGKPITPQHQRFRLFTCGSNTRLMMLFTCTLAVNQLPVDSQQASSTTTNTLLPLQDYTLHTTRHNNISNVTYLFETKKGETSQRNYIHSWYRNKTREPYF